jgi:hypothetical protein
MGDSSETLQVLWSRPRNLEKYARYHFFGEQPLMLNEDSLPWISNHIDCVVRASRGNNSVTEVVLDMRMLNEHDDSVWDKVGQAIGNLQGLKKLCIYICCLDEVLPVPAWEILTRILSRMRQRIALSVIPRDVHQRITYSHISRDVNASTWRVEDSQLFARAIRGHPTITSFDDGDNFTYESLGVLCSAMATLPALESIGLQAQLEDGSTFSNPESLTELLRVPTLRSVCFHGFSFTLALSRATANALMKGTAVTEIELTGCSFSAEECAAIMANGLGRNTSVSYIKVLSPGFNYGIRTHGVAAAPLPSNPRSQELSITGAVISALGQNTSLKTLSLGYCLMDESLCTVMQNGLGMNETLESLEITQALLDDEENAELWCRAFSFLRANKALKSLEITAESSVSVFRMYIAAVLQENTSLETLSIVNSKFPFVSRGEQYFAFIPALQHNKTLKTLTLNKNRISLLNDNWDKNKDKDKKMASLLKKNYALERLPSIGLVGDVGAILRLNEAGRRYLIEDGSSISKGVDVLSRVNNDINCVFLHLLENPRLCDRSAVEMTSTGGSNRCTKRGQASAYKGRESRRRIT